MEKRPLAIVRDHKDVVRDIKSKAIISIDKEALQAYKKKKEEQEKVGVAFKELNSVKQDITELKVLMQTILQKLG